MTERLSRAGSSSSSLVFCLDKREELEGVQFLLAARLAAFVEGGLQKDGAVDAGDFHRVLEGEENARARAFLRLHFQEVGAVEGDAAAGDVIFAAPGQDAGQGAFAAAVRPHDGVDFAGLDGKVQAFEDFLAVHAGG